MNELQKLESFRYSLAVAETFDEIKLIQDATTSFAELARLQNLSIEKQNEIGKFRIEITDKVGKWLDDNYPSMNELGHKPTFKGSGNTMKPEQMPVSKRESSNSRAIARASIEEKEKIMSEIETEGNIITPNKVATKLKDQRNSLKVVRGLSERIERENELKNLAKEIKEKFNADEVRLLIQFLNK